MKKFRMILLSAAVIIAMLFVNIVSASAATYFSDGKYTFAKNGDGTITIVSYDLEDGDMVMPESIFGDTVVAVKNLAFYRNSFIVSATFPETLTSLGDSAFNEAPNLTTVTIPENCLYVGSGALQNCPSLKNVTINAPLTAVNNQLFYNDKSLEKIELPETVQSIGRFAFSDCSSLTYVSIPKATTSIADNAFRNCPNVTIYGYNDSYAQQYAADKNISFVSLDPIEPDYEPGDVDMNDVINVKDATLIQSYAASLKTLTDYQLALADVNGDGTVNVSDATRIQLMLANLK